MKKENQELSGELPTELGKLPSVSLLSVGTWLHFVTSIYFDFSTVSYDHLLFVAIFVMNLFHSMRR